MLLPDTIQQLDHLLVRISQDLLKVRRGNKAASQRVRTGTIMLERIAKVFRKESIYAEKIGKFRKKSIVKKSVKRSKSKKKIAIQIPLVKRKLLNHREHRGHREF